MQDHIPNIKDHNNPKLAFYAPMKSPNSPRPSGDRTIGALLVKALTAAGFDVEIACDFRSWEGRGDPRAQEEIRIRGEKAASDLVNGYRADCPRNRPVAWFSYHLYHKSPDWIGPAVSRELDIPYFCAEASVSARQMDGPWGAGFTASIEAIQLARKIFNLNPRDLPALSAVDGVHDRIVPLLPFLDAETPDPASRNVRRQRLASRLRIDSDQYWLLSVAMMRDDAKLASYAQLARVAERMQRKDWMLLIVGDGAAELQVRDYFRLDKDLQIQFLGRRDSEFVLQLMSVSDLLVWPAINEAIGMTALEALAMGLPAVCGRSGGIEQIIQHGHTGLLVDAPETPDSVDLFTEAIESLFGRPGRLAAMSAKSTKRFEQCHQISAAASTLRDHILPSI